uniref:Uncharacterized protein n=1 Tax=Populus trichocarpa TaxID=3694 RepID=A0A2K1XUL3_POPTR
MNGFERERRWWVVIVKWKVRHWIVPVTSWWSIKGIASTRPIRLLRGQSGNGVGGVGHAGHSLIGAGGGGHSGIAGGGGEGGGGGGGHSGIAGGGGDGKG